MDSSNLQKKTKKHLRCSSILHFPVRVEMEERDGDPDATSSAGEPELSYIDYSRSYLGARAPDENWRNSGQPVGAGFA